MNENTNDYGPHSSASIRVCEPVGETLRVSAAAVEVSAPPSDELGTHAPLQAVDPELFDRARESVRAIRGQGRTETGQAGAGNTLALKTGLRSSRLLDAPEVAQWHASQVAAITADMGGAEELSALETSTVREVARLEVIVASMGEDLLARGTLTAKGKTRAATVTYLQVLDRFAKLSSVLGLKRRSKTLPTIQEYMRGRE